MWSLTVLFGYLCLLNELRVKVPITVNRITRLTTLSVPIPVPRPFLAVLGVALVVMSLRRSRRLALAAAVTLTAGLSLSTVGLGAAAPLATLAVATLYIVAAKEEGAPAAAMASTLVCALCLAATARYLLFFAAPSRPFSDPSWAVAELHLKVLHSLQLLSAAVYAAIPVIGAWRVARKPSWRWASPPLTHGDMSRGRASMILACSMALSAVANLIPYSPTVNPESRPVGVDVSYYASCLSKIVKMGPLGAFATAASSARAGYLLLAYLIMSVSGAQPETVAKFMPSLLLPAVVASSYFMVLKAGGSRRLAALSSLLLATSPLVTAGIYGSFQANMFALALAYLQLALYFSVSLRIALPTMLLLSTLCHLAHPWTALQVLAAMGLLAIARRGRREILASAVMVAGAVLSDCVRSVFALTVPYVTTDIASSYYHSSLSQALNNLLSFPRTIHFIVAVLYGGFMNYPLLVLALIGLLLDGDGLSDLLSAWATTAVIMYFSRSGYVSRPLLSMPLHILMARALIRLEDIHIHAAFSLSLSYYAMCLMDLVPPPCV